MTEIIDLKVAAFLDPRFRSFKYMPNASSRKSAYQQVIAYLGVERIKLGLSQTSQTVEKENQPNLQSSKKRKFSLVIDNDSNNVASDAFSLDDEINNYTNMVIKVEEHSNPLDFWKVYNPQMPILSKIIKKVLCLVASSTPSEQLFSKSGEVISEKRNRLTHAHAEQYVLLDQDIAFD